MKLTTLLIAGGLVWAVVQLANSPLARIVDRTLPGRVSLQSIDTPALSPPAESPATIAGRILNADVTSGNTPNDGALLSTVQPTIYRAPFNGTITPITNGIRYQSPELAGAIDFTNIATLPAPGPIQAGMALAVGQSVQIVRRNEQGQAVTPERSLIEALQVGAQR